MKALSKDIEKKIEDYILNDWPDSIIQSQLKESVGLKISISSIKKVRERIIGEGIYDPQKTKFIRKNGSNPQGDQCVVFDNVDEKNA